MCFGGVKCGPEKGKDSVIFGLIYLKVRAMTIELEADVRINIATYIQGCMRQGAVVVSRDWMLKGALDKMLLWCGKRCLQVSMPKT